MRFLLKRNLDLNRGTRHVYDHDWKYTILELYDLSTEKNESKLIPGTSFGENDTMRLWSYNFCQDGLFWVKIVYFSKIVYLNDF